MRLSKKMWTDSLRKLLQEVKDGQLDIENALGFGAGYIAHLINGMAK